ncbi:subtype B tannase [Campylobacter showae]|uniref:subtype B tannase n=1 Tax=Campylobacter showae TaxID=204 RepID=UPI000F083F43|nr:subtype B tannase [Campylobacter showae]
MKKRTLAFGAAACLYAAISAQAADLKFDPDKFETRSIKAGEKEVKFRAYEGIVYVANPVDSEYQRLNFYIPAQYFEGGKDKNNKNAAGKFDASSAPIFLPNSIGGYMPGEPFTPVLDKNGKPNAVLAALERGYVVAAPGARGRTLKDANGKFSGKAPAAIVDLKAAVRYLKFNDEAMAGDANKIISNGTSAGGAMSALLGVSADAPEFEPYLAALGAAKASDEIYAVSAYCPVTNLENADAAYEWMFGAQTKYEKMDFSALNAAGFNDRSGKPKTVSGELTAEQKELSAVLKSGFPAYVNSLNLKDAKGRALTLEPSGEGSFKEYVKKTLADSYAAAKSRDKSLLKPEFFTLETQGCTLGYDFKFDDYVLSMPRAKAAPAFDGLELQNPENDFFGDADAAAKHFTEFSAKRGTGEIADAKIIKMANAMSYLGNANAAKFYRIRHGAADSDTALAVPLILALGLQNAGKTVDFAAPWGQGHGGNYDLDELFRWIDRVVK